MRPTREHQQAVKRSVVLALGGFTGSALATAAKRQSLSREELVSLAAEYHVGDRDSGRLAQRPPLALRDAESGEGTTLDIELSPETWKLLEQQAREERITVERLLEHATLRLIADLDSGRVSARITSDTAE